jgi:hypothetical protein
MTTLEKFVELVEHQAAVLLELTGEKPSVLRINEDILTDLARSRSFWETPQFKTQVTTTAPILNKFKCFSIGKTLLVLPDRTELFFRLE